MSFIVIISSNCGQGGGGQKIQNFADFINGCSLKVIPADDLTAESGFSVPCFQTLFSSRGNNRPIPVAEWRRVLSAEAKSGVIHSRGITDISQYDIIPPLKTIKKRLPHRPGKKMQPSVPHP